LEEKKTHEKYYSVFPNKINKDNFRKNHKKNHLEKYCSNPQCYVRKTTTLFTYDLALFVIIILNQLNIKKKINKDNFKKNHKKNHVEKHCSNS